MKKYKEDLQKLEGPTITESAALHGQCAHFLEDKCRNNNLKSFSLVNTKVKSPSSGVYYFVRVSEP